MSQFLAADLKPEDEEVERSLRPRRLDDFVGQDRIKEQLQIVTGRRQGPWRGARPCPAGRAARARRRRWRRSSAKKLGVGLRTVAGPALEKKDIAAILTAIEPRDVLFIDEIHRLNRAAEEILYPALEDFRLDIVFGQGAAARTLTLDLPSFTLVGATTRSGLLTTPLRDRFGMTFRLGYYAPGELGTIVRRSQESSMSRSRTMRPTRSRCARGARHASRTESSGACATWQRCAMQV